MQEITFSIPVSGVVRIEDGSIIIRVNRAETLISFRPEPEEKERRALPKGTTVFDVLLETARDFVASTGQTRFTSGDLYRLAIVRYPDLKRNTWTSHTIASAPDHPSYRHHSSKRDFFRYLGGGAYQLQPKFSLDTGVS